VTTFNLWMNEKRLLERFHIGGSTSIGIQSELKMTDRRNE